LLTLPTFSVDATIIWGAGRVKQFEDIIKKLTILTYIIGPLHQGKARNIFMIKYYIHKTNYPPPLPPSITPEQGAAQGALCWPISEARSARPQAPCPLRLSSDFFGEKCPFNWSTAKDTFVTGNREGADCLALAVLRRDSYNGRGGGTREAKAL